MKTQQTGRLPSIRFRQPSSNRRSSTPRRNLLLLKRSHKFVTKPPSRRNAGFSDTKILESLFSYALCLAYIISAVGVCAGIDSKKTGITVTGLGSAIALLSYTYVLSPMLLPSMIGASGVVIFLWGLKMTFGHMDKKPHSPKEHNQ